MKLKELNEKLSAAQKALKEMMDAAEERANSEEASKKLEDLLKEVEDLKARIALEERAEKALAENGVTVPAAETAETVTTEVRAASLGSAKDTVARYIRGEEVRADEMTVTSTGGIVPSEFSQDIIRQVKELSGIINLVSVVNSKGTYKQIVADSENKISAGWTDEIAEITASDAKFTTIEIGHEKLAALVKLSLEVINQTGFDIVSEVVEQMVEDFALKAETAIISGTGEGQPTGLTSAGTAYTLASSAAITADEIIQIYHTLKSSYQYNAQWLMSNDTLCAIRQLQDGAGRYIFTPTENLTNGFVGTILGKPVLVSEAMDSIGSGTAPILFGDFGRAYKINVNPEMTLQVLTERYAEYGVKGIVGIMWLDGKPVDSDAYVTVSCPTDAETTEETT